MPKPRHPNRTTGTLRIIGGRWRGRKLRFADVPELRPTPDRVRETLFNWLRDVIPGTRCLDLFAGSGALSLEALSRGAAEARLVDRHTAVIRVLQAQLHTLQVQGAELIQADALTFLSGTARPADVVFLDPPYGQNVLLPCLTLLAAGNWLVPGAWVYVEMPRQKLLMPLPAVWQARKHQEAGQIRYYLLRYGSPEPRT